MRWSKSKETLLVLVFALLVWYRASRHPVLLWVAGGFVLTGLFLPVLADAIHRVWMKLGELLGAITSRILLTVIFFVVFVPLGFVSRLLGKNALLVTSSGRSFFTIKEHTYSKEDLENPW
ncbi:MAG TPA: SxtJ family membrane protein [Puia sp.]|jgi:hypothetical protein